jgi:hypothetical protein
MGIQHAVQSRVMKALKVRALSSDFSMHVLRAADFDVQAYQTAYS